MNNKKLLSLALAGVIITAMPFNVFAGENEGEPDDKPTVEENSSKKVTVKFDSDGGSEVAVQKIEKWETAETPAAPTKKGYKFKGWYDGFLFLKDT